jgi:hypothetical protein
MNLRVKIIEKALLNQIEIIFEGAYFWSIISRAEYKDAEKNFNSKSFKNEYKIIFNKETKKNLYKKKCHIAKRIFKPTNFGFRRDKSVHQALHHIKTK